MLNSPFELSLDGGRVAMQVMKSSHLQRMTDMMAAMGEGTYFG